MREKNSVTVITKPDKHPAVQQADLRRLFMAKVRFPLSKPSLDTKQRRIQLSVTLPVQWAAREASHISHTCLLKARGDNGAQLLSCSCSGFFFFFPSQKRIAFCMVTPLHPKGQQWEKCSHSWNTIVLRFPLQPVLQSWWDISPWRWQFHLLQEWMGKDLCCSSPQEYC